MTLRFVKPPAAHHCPQNEAQTQWCDVYSHIHAPVSIYVVSLLACNSLRWAPCPRNTDACALVCAHCRRCGRRPAGLAPQGPAVSPWFLCVDFVSGHWRTLCPCAHRAESSRQLMSSQEQLLRPSGQLTLGGHFLHHFLQFPRGIKLQSPAEVASLTTPSSHCPASARSLGPPQRE